MGQRRDKQPQLVEFGRRVRARRERQGLTQEQLAERAGLHATYVASVERGERNISLLTMLKLADGLSADPAGLLRGLATL